MKKNSRIYVAGHRGLIGSAVERRLHAHGFDNIVHADRAELELTDEARVNLFFDDHHPEYVVLAAGRVGGIVENQSFPADFINTNLAIQLNVLRAAHRHGVRKLILFASSCMYPRECPQPMAEDALLTGRPEPTSLAYAISKLAGMQMCLAYNQQFGEQRFIPVIPNSAFGPNDNFDPRSGHVLSALIRRFHEARSSKATNVVLWGSGTPRREFVHADDIAEASIRLLSGDTTDLPLPVNIGTGTDYSIQQLATLIARVVGFDGQILWDSSKPDGAPRKLLDSSRIRGFGWRPSIDFEQGVRQTYQWYLEHVLQTETSS
jgi:GDP-L-fucose synthase